MMERAANISNFTVLNHKLFLKVNGGTTDVIHRHTTVSLIGGD